jgi:hypothetical protein
MEQNMNISVIVFPNGYREASLHGAILVVRPDGSHSWANVQTDSGLYAALNAALFNNTTSGA